MPDTDGRGRSRAARAASAPAGRWAAPLLVSSLLLLGLGAPLGRVARAEAEPSRAIDEHLPGAGPRPIAPAGPPDPRAPAGQAPEALDQATERERVLRVARRTLAMTEEADEAMRLWDWESGVALAGLMHAYAQTGDPALLDAVADWVDARLAERPTLTHANHATPAWAALWLYEERPDPRYLATARDAVDHLVHRAPRVHGTLAHYDDQLWDDTLIVSVPLLARYGARHDCPSCLILAADEVLAHARRLQDPGSGRWYHGWDLSDFRAGRQPYMSAAQWARGNGWTALATTEVLAWLPETHPWHAELRERLGRQLRGLAAMQDRSGLWHTVVTEPDFYLESSGSAAIAAAMLRATAAGWLPDPQLRSVGLTAARAVDAKLAADGTLTGVSTGTGVAPSLEVYDQVPYDSIEPYGQGLYLIMAEARSR